MERSVRSAKNYRNKTYRPTWLDMVRQIYLKRKRSLQLDVHYEAT